MGTGTGAQAGQAPHIAFLSNSSGAYDARTMRMARTAVRAGYRVTVYARLQDGLPQVEEADGYRIIRAHWHWMLGIPGLRRLAWQGRVGDLRDQERRSAATRVGTDAGQRASAPGRAPGVAADEVRRAGVGVHVPSVRDRVSVAARLARRVVSVPGRVRRRLVRQTADLRRVLLAFPFRPLGWAVGLERVVEPADIWHGMWAGSLPALGRLSRRHGGRTIYDSRDVFMVSREYSSLRWPVRGTLIWLERRWARGVDRVLTTNDSYANLIAANLGVPTPVVVMNCPERWQPPSERPDHIRRALGLGAETGIVLYQGQLTSERGIEQSMDAILEVPAAVLVLLGFGRLERRYRAMAAAAPYAGRVFVLPAVPPTDLLGWTASADVSLMAIQPTTLNHRHTTPQKLFESLSAGVPIVASDLPGMAAIIRETGAGLLCDPTSPSSIAQAIRAILEAPPDARAAMVDAAMTASRGRYSWESQEQNLLGVYRALTGDPR